MSRMPPDSHLWKLAALEYEKKIKEPAERVGVVAPEWPWQHLKIHYEHHHVHPALRSYQRCRELGAMRQMIVNQMVFVRDDGVREIDQNQQNQYQRLVQLEQKEYSLLSSFTSARSRSQGAGAEKGAAKAKEAPR